MWEFGAVALLVGGGLGYGYTVQKRRLALMQSTETSTVAHLQELTASMAAGVGAGALSYHTEMQGKAYCDTPLIWERVVCTWRSYGSGRRTLRDAPP